MPKISCGNQLLKNYFLRLRLQRVHQPHPAHGATGFQFLGNYRQAMPVLIHTGPQRRKSLCDFPLCLLVEGSAPKPL